MENIETCVVGCLLLDGPRTLAAGAEMGCDSSWFENPVYGDIWTLAGEMSSSGVPVDLFSVDREIRQKRPYIVGMMGELKFADTLREAIDKTPTVEHLSYYLKELRKTHTKRAAKSKAREIIDEIDKHDEPDQYVSESAKELLDVASIVKAKSKEDIKRAIMGRWRPEDGQTAGLPTPWSSFNRRFGGLHPGIVTLFTGRGGKGKSSAVATWAHFLAGKGHRVGWLPFEDGVERTYSRLSSIDGEFSSFQLDVHNSTPEDLDKAQYHLEQVLAMPIYMEDRHMYADQIFSWAMRQVAVHGIEVLFIDAFKDILRRKNDLGEDESISRTLCEMARRGNLRVVVNHHVRKGIAGEDRSDLTESDIRGTGQIANDARQIIILQNRIGADGNEEFEFEIAKNSYGPNGRFPMIRVSRYNKWVAPEDMEIKYK